MSDTVNKLLRGVKQPNRRNMICDMPELVEAIEYFLDLKVAGGERVRGITLSWLYKSGLREKFDGPIWFGTVRKYVREYLKRDHRTGKAL